MPSFTKDGSLKISITDPGIIKVQDDDDGLWRFLRSQDVQGQQMLYLVQPGDTTPGLVARVQSDDDGLWRVIKSKTVQGMQLIYLSDPV